MTRKEKAVVRSRLLRKSHQKEYNEYLVEWRKQYKKKAIKNGWCRKCKTPVIKDFKTCQKHLDQSRRQNRKSGETIKDIRKKDHPSVLEALSNPKKKCAVCGSKYSKGRGWHVDHDHKTKKFRGILCHFCNVGLGNLKDSIKILKKATLYLQGKI